MHLVGAPLPDFLRPDLGAGPGADHEQAFLPVPSPSCLWDLSMNTVTPELKNSPIWSPGDASEALTWNESRPTSRDSVLAALDAATTLINGHLKMSDESYAHSQPGSVAATSRTQLHHRSPSHESMQRSILELSPFFLGDRDAPSRSLLLFGVKRVPLDVIFELAVHTLRLFFLSSENYYSLHSFLCPFPSRLEAAASHA